MNRDAATQQVQANLVKLARQGTVEWLPMPYTGARRIEKAWREYRERRQHHLYTHPGYDSGWRRPTPGTAESVWKLLTRRVKLRLGDLIPNHRWLSPDDVDALATQAMQALAAALDAAVLAGENGRMLTTNTIFDTLASGWSDHYRKARETGPATSSWEMRRDTLRASWRDLLLNGIKFEALLTRVHDGCGLYTTKRIPKRGYTVALDAEARTAREEFVEILKADPDYDRVGGYPRLRLGSEEAPQRDTVNNDTDAEGTDDELTQKVAAEWGYNVARAGQRSVGVIQRLEAARLYLHVPTFMEDVAMLEKTAHERRENIQAEYAKLRAKKKTKRSRKLPLSPSQRRTIAILWEKYEAVHGPFMQLRDVRDRLQKIAAVGGLDEGEFVQIRSGFYKLSNRRYQARNFWPTEVTGKDRRVDLVAEAEAGGQITVDADGRRWRRAGRSALFTVSSQRGRWFQVAATGLEDAYADKYEWQDPDWAGDRRPLVGVDVSASQIQLLAVFLGLQELEHDLAQQPFKKRFAELAWERHEDTTDQFRLPERFQGPDDGRLQAAVKQAAMTHLYGSELKDVAYNLRISPSEYGPGLGDEHNIDSLLRDPRLKLTGILEWFLPACQAAAEIAYDRDEYAGVEFTDPFDGAKVRWNPVRRRRTPCAGKGRVKVYASLPQGLPNAAGDYPVDRQKLRRVVAPCLTHMLDAMFAGLVIEKLNGLGVKDVVSIHDSWMISSDAAPALYEAIEAAGEPWLLALGAVYSDLAGYLGGHRVYGPWIQDIRRKWERRVAEARWPVFRVGDAALVQMTTRPPRT